MNESEAETGTETLYEFSLYNLDGTFFRRYPCVPPFEEAPWIAVVEDRYFVLNDDLTYHESRGVHFLPSAKYDSAKNTG